jgi:23S rRNA pseudouridine2605 synthase
VVIREGRNREVRRLWDSQGFLVSRLKRIRYGKIELPRNLRRGECEALDAESVKQLRQTTGLGAPQPVLTLSPVLHQRRANRNVTEYRPERGASSAWTGGQDEARELRAYDRIREEPTRGRKPPRRDGREVNGNVARPERGAGGNRGGKSRRVAPGQELPSVRTWFAGESRDGSGRPGAPRGNAAGAAGNRRPGGGKPSGQRAGGGSGNPYSGFGGESRGTGAGGNRAPAGRGARPQRPAAAPPQGAGRPQGHGGNRPQGGGRPQGQGGNRSQGAGRPQGHGGPAGGRPPGRGGNRSGNR